MRSNRLFILASLLAALGPLRLPAQTAFSFLDLGTLGGSYVMAYAVNEAGQVAGYSYSAGNTAAHGFRTAPNQPINPATDDLGSLGVGLESNAMGINESGQVVGWAQAAPYGAYLYHALRAGPGLPLTASTDDLGGLGGKQAVARGLNDLGDAVGYAQLGNGVYHAFRVPAGRKLNPSTDDLGRDLPGASYARAINNGGQVTGYYVEASGSQRAYRTGPGLRINPATDSLGTLGGASSTGWDINELGQVVGASGIAGVPNVTHAFRTAPNQAIQPGDDLGTLPGYNYSEALAINNRGQVVGRSFNLGSDISRAFFHDGTRMLDLNDFALMPAGCVLKEAWDVNDAGQIVGRAVINGATRGFLLTPIPEPGAAALGAAGLAVLAACRRPARRGAG